MVALSMLSHVLRGISTNVYSPDGVAPFVYSIEINRSGGSINSDGRYTAGNKVGVDTIKIVDANLEEATVQIFVGGVEHLICDIIAKEMEIDPSRVIVWNQKFNNPTDENIWIAVGLRSPLKAYANNIKYEGGDTGLVSYQYASFKGDFFVDISSRNTDARDRKEEVAMALASDYARRQQDQNFFYIGPVAPGVDISNDEDGAAIPYTFSFNFGVLYTRRKQKEVPYFDDFTEPSILIDN